MKLGLLLVVLAAGAMVPWAQQSPQGKGAQGKEQGKGAPKKKQPRKQSLEKADVPQPPQGKQDEPLPAILEPARGPAERRDLVQKFRARHRLEGIYRLRKMIVKGGSVIKGARGYLFMGHRHMSMQLYAPSNRPKHANLQSVVRSFRVVGNQLVMSTLLGHRNDQDGDVLLEGIGNNAQRRFELTGAVLRIYLDSSEYVEFERVE